MRASYGIMAVALASLAACSFMARHGEPRSGRPARECTSSSAAPLLDIGLALVYTGVFVYAPALQSDSSPDVPQPAGVGIAQGVSVLLGATHAVSALTGVASAERCAAQQYAAPASPPDGPPSPTRTEMWCTQTPTRAACTRTERHCDRLRSELAPDGTAPLCEATEPVCFRVDGALRVCAPDAVSCARERTIYNARSPGMHFLSRCTP